MHKIFISYYHNDDQWYKDYLVDNFGHLMISKSVNDGDIDTDISTEYTKQLIRDGYIADSSVVLLLVGPNTRKRKHVDWETYAGLTSQANGSSGLLGIYLPEMPRNQDDTIKYDDMPQRFADNRKSDFAVRDNWASFISSEVQFNSMITQAFNNRTNKADKIDNSRLQMQRNLT